MPENSKGPGGPDKSQGSGGGGRRGPDSGKAPSDADKQAGGEAGGKQAGALSATGAKAPKAAATAAGAKSNDGISGGKPDTKQGAAGAGEAGASGGPSSAKASPAQRSFKKPANHHDKFFKRIFSQLPFAQELLRLFFPPANLSCFDLSALRIEKDAWANKLADLVLSLPLSSHLRASHLKVPHLKTAGPLLFFIVVEHKSHPDPQFMHKQLYYKTAVHEHILRIGRLSPVISALFYHGKEPWGQPPGFLKGVWGDFFDKDLDFLKKFMIDYEVKIIDINNPEIQKALQSGEFETIRPFVNLMANIWALKNATEEELKAVLAEFGEFSDRKDIILSIADYLESADVIKEPLWRKLEKELVLKGTFKKGGYMDIQEEIKQRGVLEGRKQGMQQGIQQGVQQGMQQGMQQGRRERDREVISNMLKKNLNVSLISSVTGLPEAEIVKLKNGS